MSKTISGRDALEEIDRSIALLRRRLSDAVTEEEVQERRQTEVRDEQLLAYKELADIRLQYLDENGVEDLDRVHREALALLGKHDKSVADQQQAIDAAQDHLKHLEDKRVEVNTSLANTVEAYETLVAEVEAALSKDPIYQELVQNFDDAESVAHRAREKLSVARDERDEKGEPYEQDPLFMYLWKRGFRTTEYEGGGLFKMLDGWVAKLCKYDDARANYQRLNDIPAWLEQHLKDKEVDVAVAREALEAAEQKALDDAGTEDARKKISTLRTELEQLDKAIEQSEDAHRSTIATYHSLIAGEKGPIQDARTVLAEGLKKFAFEDLRELAAETVTKRDDDLVDNLVALRTEELDLDVSAERRRSKPLQLQEDLSEFEVLRRKFKAAQMDSHYAQLRSHTFNEALADLMQGLSGADAVFSRLRRNMKRRKPKAGYGFGGSRRQATLGLPEILGDIGREIAREVEREMIRGGGGFGGYSGGSRRGRRTSFPSASKKRKSRMPSSRKGRGGFKTGGGF
ncbi:MAG: hypothetical protein AAGI14_04820 [Pseudomonadota bacterium]